MDAFDILAKAEELGGKTRRQAMMKAFRKARDLGCDVLPGGGKVGGFNVRYGSLKYQVMDMNTKGEVFLHLKAHPNKDIDEETQRKGNEFITNLGGITIKNAPINHYGQTEETIEDIPEDDLYSFLEYAVNSIRTEFYRPHIEGR